MQRVKKLLGVGLAQFCLFQRLFVRALVTHHPSSCILKKLTAIREPDWDFHAFSRFFTLLSSCSPFGTWNFHVSLGFSRVTLISFSSPFGP